jgi:hypothetical protein
MSIRARAAFGRKRQSNTSGIPLAFASNSCGICLQISPWSSLGHSRSRKNTT